MSEEYRPFGRFELVGEDITAEGLEAELSRILKEQGVKDEDCDVRVEPEGMGLTGAEVLVVCAPLALKILEDLWDKIFLPIIEEKWGRDSLQRSKQS